MATSQLALEITGTPPAPEQWGVVVDEVLLNSLGTAAGNWWAVSAAQFHRSGKLRTLLVLPIGAVEEIGPFSRDDAEFARDHIIESGVHPRAVKARRWTEQPHLLGCRKAKPCRLCTPVTTAAVARQDGEPEQAAAAPADGRVPDVFAAGNLT